MSLVSQMREKFNKGPATMTPEAHALFLKQAKEKELQAVQIAKARAARYNMTLRSIAIQTTKSSSSSDATGNNNNNKASSSNIPVVKGTTTDQYKKKNSESGNMEPKKYSLKSVQFTVATQDQVGMALNHNRPPTVAKEFVEAAAKEVEVVIEKEDIIVKRNTLIGSKPASRAPSLAAPSKEAAEKLAAQAAQEVEVPSSTSAWSDVAKALDDAATTTTTTTTISDDVSIFEQANAAAAAVSAVDNHVEPGVVLESVEVPKGRKSVAVVTTESVVQVLEEAKVPITPEIVESIQTEDSPSVVGQQFEMVELKKAIEEGCDDKINTALVVEFLESHAPERVAEVPKLMEEFKGKEEELMEKLADDIPDPAEVIEKSIVAELTGNETIEELNILELKRQEVEKVAQDELEELESMTPEERAKHDAKTLALQQHSEQKDRMLKQQLNIYSAGGTGGAAKSILAGGRGRGRGKKNKDSGRAATEFIVSGVNTDGDWQVNPEGN